MKSIILIALVCLLHCTVINYASDQNCPTTSTTSISSYTSPINFDYYNSKNMKFPGYPKFVLNSTYYTPINNKAFEYMTSTACGTAALVSCDYIGMDVTGFGEAYFLYLNQTVVYTLKELRLHVYSEHTFQGHKMDMELQLIHELNTGITDPTLVASFPSDHYKNLNMAVLFSTARDKKSDFVDDIIEEDEDKTKETDSKYSFAKVKTLDLNQFFNFFNPYYYYTGTGTTPFDCNVMTEWIVNQDVEYMSQKQLRQIQLARLNRKDASGSKSTDIYQNGNARIVNDRYSGEIEYHENTEKDGDYV